MKIIIEIRTPEFVNDLKMKTRCMQAQSEYFAEQGEQRKEIISKMNGSQKFFYKTVDLIADIISWGAVLGIPAGLLFIVIHGLITR